MKRIFYAILALAGTLSIWTCSSGPNEKKAPDIKNQIRFNQLGYLPGEVKKAVLTDCESSEFSLTDTAGNVVYSGKLTGRGRWDASGENVKVADFTGFDKEGNYRIYVKGIGSSASFRISPVIFDNIFHSSVKAYYIQRASASIEEKYAGQFTHPLAHPDNRCFLHPSTGHKSGVISSPRGWYDAGDYNKYIVNAGYTVSMLLTLYENFPELYPDNSNIPESGNGISDLLDEIRYELDWAETMQDGDGGVFFKLTSKSFCGFVRPQDDTLKRYVVGKSTSAALNFAAMFAQASRVWKKYDEKLSLKYLGRSERAWKWAIKNPAVIFRNPPDISTGEYGHSDFRGDFFWAAAELYATTGNPVYGNYLKSNQVSFTFVQGNSWFSYLKNLGYYSLILPESKAGQQMKDSLKSSIVGEADRQAGLLEKAPYLQPLNSFVWGSNSDILDLAVIFAQAYRITGDKKYLDAVIETVDYIFGKNATGYSFVTGYGSRPPMNPHHRLSASDNVPEPVPGWVVGGPNGYRNDQYSEKAPYGVKYPATEPAKCYLDQTASYASNEIAINWNAPLAYITGFLVNYSASKVR
ncbi:MAG TPA: glycoside hydrolase family 9 protein [Bacteroidales bacterium]|nr:glycoside hydrolase family 9 protein [Bacteroidales bacterium]